MRQLTYAAWLWILLSTTTLFAQQGQEVSIGSFSDIELSIAATVYLTQGPLKVHIDATDPRDFDALNKSAHNDSWHIKFTPSIWSQKGIITIYISVPQLKDIDITGSGQVIGQQAFKGEKFEFSVTGSGAIDFELEDAQEVKAEVTGSGHVVLKGQAEEIEIKIAGSGSIDATHLQVAEADAEITGSGYAKVFAIRELEAEIMGSGTVYYKGQPKIEANTFGSGQVKPL